MFAHTQKKKKNSYQENKQANNRPGANIHKNLSDKGLTCRLHKDLLPVDDENRNNPILLLMAKD